MKIRDTNEVGRIVPTAAPESVRPQQSGDKVTVEAQKEVEQAVAAAQLSSASARGAKLQALEAAIAAGSYKPNPGQIADQLLESAELTARLRAML
jgi:flagellar biosynthesis anti-sigma factor FlgM